jgi:hypothetical protein
MAGKSTAARQLGQRHDRAVIATDDLGVAVRAATNAAALVREDHREYFVTRTVDELWRDALGSMRALAPAIEAVAREHAQPWGQPALIEGWAILPELLDDDPLDLARVWLLPERALVEARMRADRSFWEGASDVETMIERFVARSLRLNEHVREAARRKPLKLVPVRVGDSPEAIADRIEALLPS